MFDAQMRRGTGQMAPEWFVRKVEPGEQGWTGVVWSDLKEDSADREFEWKPYSHDCPADLAERLTAALPETLMITEIPAMPKDTPPSAGIRFETVTDVAGVDLLSEVDTCLRDRRYPPPRTPAGLVTGQQ
ncbi:hypothetical protein [Streptomyces mirabilis]|uniref:hypothetical protein n=1 Tax=Streptomyces mirabilis TaxID=68239 RepID=UPI00225549B8|nr:hypothetical protein [Streptomyces mirabilis]